MECIHGAFPRIFELHVKFFHAVSREMDKHGQEIPASASSSIMVYENCSGITCLILIDIFSSLAISTNLFTTRTLITEETILT
jgi:hypothetical protein